MTDLVPYQQNDLAIAPANPRAQLDSWVSVMADTAKLAEYIAQTEFVPDAMRGRPAAVTACILTGREMNLEPMTALRHIHIVKGKPGLSAELMRAQVLSKGHEIQYLETTDTRCVVQGRRRGETEWTRVSFTADQARKAKIDLGGYPEDKLIARATSRLCRRKFADVVAGLAAVDELEDGIYNQGASDTSEAAQIEAPKTTRRTAQRRKPDTAPPARQPAQHTTPTAAATQPTSAGPPLPGEAGYDDTPAQPDAQDVGDNNTSADPDAADEDSINKAQSSKLHAIFTRAGYTGTGSRIDRLAVASGIVGRELGSSSDLTKQEASVLIDTLEMLAERGDLTENVEQLLSAVQAARDEDALLDEYEEAQVAEVDDAAQTKESAQ